MEISLKPLSRFRGPLLKDQSLQPFRVAQAEKEAIYLGRFAEGKSLVQLAEEFGRDRNTLARVLGTKEASERKEQILSAIGEEAKSKLRRAASRAADSWIKQFDLVDQGQRGDHRPAKDLLTHVGVVDVPKPVVEEKSRMLIWIGQGSGQPPVVVDPQGNRYNPEDFPEHDPIVEVLGDEESDEPSEGEPQPAAELHDDVTDPG